MGFLDGILKKTPNIQNFEQRREVEALINVVKGTYEKPGDIDLIADATKALGRIGDKRAITPIEERLNDFRVLHSILASVRPKRDPLAEQIYRLDPKHAPPPPDPVKQELFVLKLSAAISNMEDALSMLQKAK